MISLSVGVWSDNGLDGDESSEPALSTATVTTAARRGPYLR
jgi:hypothetical protein